MAFSRETLAALKQRADIVQIIGEKVVLRPSGANFKGLCPFHTEKSPSFTVNPGRGIYHCFGCGAGGSVIDFVMAHQQLDFPEAVRELAQRVGLPLEETSRNGPRERAAELLEAAQRRYHELLCRSSQAEAGRLYLRERGFEEEDWQAFGLGFAPPGWQGLSDWASREGFSQQDQLASGLVKTGKNGTAYDLLRKRVVFPIRDGQGRCIGFGGRAIDPLDTPKYLNTPETRYYRKSQVLFGLAEARDALRKTRGAIVAEGYLDVIRLHQAGFREALATCGTALSAEHVALLGRHVERVLLLFDGDAAGERAALRCAPLFMNQGIEARVVTLPEGLDPDDFLARQGAEALAPILAAASPILEYAVWRTLERHGNTPAGKERSLHTLLPLLRDIRSDTARDMTLRHLADLLGVRAEQLSRMLVQRPAPGNSNAAPDSPALGLAAKESRHQRMFLKILLEHRHLLGQAREWLKSENLAEILPDEQLRRLFANMLSLEDKIFARLEPEALCERFPESAPTVRTLLLEGLPALSSQAQEEAALQYELALLKESLKYQLFLKFKQVTGTAEEELVLRRFLKVRDELRAMKSVSASRSILYDPETAQGQKQRLYGNQAPFSEKTTPQKSTLSASGSHLSKAPV